jgi:crotonobetainyl-CoA:carnitine CoA-transferase CaiB-like acyl-CoA transferase
MAGTMDAAAASIWVGCGGDLADAAGLQVTGAGDLPSVFAVSDLAAAAVGAAGLAVAELVAARHGGEPRVAVDRRLASFWFGTSIRPDGWAASEFEPLTGDYQAADGWIRLHVNAPHHRAATLAVLEGPADKASVAAAVRRWNATALEEAVVANGGCAAVMRDGAAWAAHPQGSAVMAEPLLHVAPGEAGPAPGWRVPAERPLQGVRVLDLTRVIAGPVSTRFLAGFGAEVLRIDPPFWDEPAVVPDMVLGKRCARLDLRQAADRAVLEGLLRGADVMVHGYRSDALERMGLGVARRHELRPGLVDVSLDAYGWTGPWRARRGFDSLVQMSCGIAAAGMVRLGRDRPTPLPVQALDHATGYLAAAAAVRGLTGRLTTGLGSTMRTSLARMAAQLMGMKVGAQTPLAPEGPADLGDRVEITDWGPAHRVKPPCHVAGAPMHWDRPATDLGTARAAWLE